MHHLNPYYHYSAELLRSALVAQQSAATSPTSTQSVAAAAAAFNIESLLAPRPLLPRPSAISPAAAAYFPYLPSAAAAAALNLPTQHDIMAGKSLILCPWQQTEFY